MLRSFGEKSKILIFLLLMLLISTQNSFAKQSFYRNKKASDLLLQQAYKDYNHISGYTVYRSIFCNHSYKTLQLMLLQKQVSTATYIDYYTQQILLEFISDTNTGLSLSSPNFILDKQSLNKLGLLYLLAPYTYDYLSNSSALSWSQAISHVNSTALDVTNGYIQDAITTQDICRSPSFIFSNITDFRSSWDFRCTDSAPMYFKNEDGSFQRRVEGFYHESGICSYNIKYIKFDGYDIYRLPLSDDYEFRIIVPPENVDPNKAFQYQNFNYNLELAARRARSLNSQTNYRFILFVPNLYIQGNFDLSRDFYSNIPMNASQSVAIRVDKYGVQMRAISKSVADLIYVDPSNPYVHTNQLVYPYESLGIQHRNYQLSYFSPHFLTRPFAWHLRDSRQDTILAMGIVRHP